jgi:hypothetical protein
MTRDQHKVGDRVRFRDPSHDQSWFLKESVGFVVGITTYGALESMVTARFGGQGVHVAGKFLEIVDG